MDEQKKFYWLKLKRDFFKRHDIRIIEAMPNGKDYILFYLKLLLESIDHEGSLRFSETIPYNEEMLAVITNTNIDIVRSAMKLFMELKMMEIYDDSTIFMNEVQKLIGSETKWAEKKRKQRLKEDNVLALSPPCPNDVRQEIEIEKEIELEIKEEEYTAPAAPPSPPTPPSPEPKTELVLFGPQLQAAFDDWLKYKTERRESYKETGLRNLIGEIKNNAAKYGEVAVAELIRHSMASNWRGIIFDRLKGQQRPQSSGVSFWDMKEESERR